MFASSDNSPILREERNSTINKVLSEMRERTGFKGGRESLRKIVKEIGFQYAKLDGRKFLMERYDVQCLRTRFLEKMQNVKENRRNVIYLDETWVNQNYTVGKCWKDNKSENASGIKVPSGKRWPTYNSTCRLCMWFHSNAELTFTAKNDGDYHRQMNHEVFEEWFRCQLLPNIPPASVIVMDNAPYHSRKVEKYQRCQAKRQSLQSGSSLKVRNQQRNVEKSTFRDGKGVLC
ncbi:uncharacterized protein [Macrobrachium rosenbergii]|uniref:uncharacterized protein n=1 Tax=Macrobrachium rosenbergii TaxID=79674 RepID=UPI0034D644D8